MDARDIIERMEALLEEERGAIVRLDGKKVDAIAGEKKALADALERRPVAERAQASRELGHLVAGLKTNGVLLAQARGVLSDLLVGQGVALRGRTSLRLMTQPPLRHLSVRG